jgi:hypothetical protein
MKDGWGERRSSGLALSRQEDTVETGVSQLMYVFLVFMMMQTEYQFIIATM